MVKEYTYKNFPHPKQNFLHTKTIEYLNYECSQQSLLLVCVVHEAQFSVCVVLHKYTAHKMKLNSNDVCEWLEKNI